MDSMFDPLGLLFRSLLAPKMAETGLGNRLGPAKSRSRALCFGLGGFQERSKRPPRAVQEASKSSSRGLQELKRLQDGFHRPRGTAFNPSGTPRDPKINDFQGPQDSKSLPRYSKTSLFFQEHSKINQAKPSRRRRTGLQALPNGLPEGAGGSRA